MNKSEELESNENREEFSSRIMLNIIRHSKAEKGGERKLTPEGRQMALSQSENYRVGEGMDQSVAFGSPTVRAKETAVLIMGGPEAFTGDESLEELKAKIDEGRKYGTKLSEDKGLNYVTSPVYEEALGNAYSQGKAIEFLVRESDTFVNSRDDHESSSYSRVAAHIAALVEKYITIAPRFDELVKNKNYNATMERFFGTHAGISECFLLKVVEKLKGVEERDRLMHILGAGFDNVEGLRIEIDNVAGQEKSKIHLRYEKKDKEGKAVYGLDEEIAGELLDEIIGEGKDHNNED